MCPFLCLSSWPCSIIGEYNFSSVASCLFCSWDNRLRFFHAIRWTEFTSEHWSSPKGSVYLPSILAGWSPSSLLMPRLYRCLFLRLSLTEAFLCHSQAHRHLVIRLFPFLLLLFCLNTPGKLVTVSFLICFSPADEFLFLLISFNLPRYGH